jgi:anaerobic selenocysteine-containing dehydrogenase
MIHWLLSNGHADSEFIESHTYGLDRLADRAAEWTLERAADVAAISVDRLRQLLRWYVELNPAVIRCGWGPERNRNGGSAIAAILAIPAIANKFGRRGGGFTMSNSGAWKLDAASSIQAARPDTRHINMNRVGESLLHLTDPPITSLFVYNCNPLATLPEQNKVLSGLQREDLFTVVFDQAMTDTATYADIVLPATTFLEHHDLRNGYGYPKMGEVKPVITPVGEARPNYEVFADLVKRMGLARPDDVVDAEGLKRAVLGDTRLRQLKPTGGMEPEGGFHPVQMVDALPLTPSGRIELYPRQLAEHDDAQWYVHLPDPKTAEFPLALLSPSSSRTVNSTLGQLLDKPAAILLNPYDADQRGLAEGQTVRVHNASGEVVVDLKVDNRVRPGVAELPKGLWRRHTKNGQTANALAPDTLSHVGQGACFNDARVEVSAL